MNYTNSVSVSSAVSLARSAHVAIVFIGLQSSEGTDSPLNLSISDNQMVAQVAAAQPNTIVVLHNPHAVLMPWAMNVSSIVCAFYPGQEDGMNTGLAQKHT